MIDDLLDDFEAQWRAGLKPSLRAYLARVAGPDRRAGLGELARLELEYRVRAGEPARVEEYLAAFPELADDADTVLDLITLEYRVRGDLGDPPRVADYLARFPRQARELAARLAAAGAPPDVPGYDDLREVGRGGMGVVYRARDAEFDRPVAVKVLRPEHPAGAARFLAEAGVTGRLQHPGVPPAYRVGTLADGRPFLAMKLVAGRTLADVLADPGADRSGLLRVFESVCETVAFAHAAGVVHRDLKPANVMVGAFGEVQVMDWGLAKSGDRRRETGFSENRVTATRGGALPDDTVAGSILGTPHYMAPEQARGELDRVGPRADVFSLGAVLCEILTGHPPYAGRPDPLAAAQSADLAAARQRLAECPADRALTALARDCLAPDPAGRPAGPAEIGRRVAEYRRGVEERLRRAEQERAAEVVRRAEERKRRKVRAGLCAALVVLALGGGGFAWFADYKRQEAATRSAAAGARTGAALDQAEKSLREDRAAEAKLSLDEAHALLDADARADRDGELSRRLGSLRRQHDLLGRLDAIRDRQGTMQTGGAFDDASARRDFPVVFREFDIDVTNPAAVAAAVREWAIREQVVGALDQWLFVENREPNLPAVLAALDPDAPRNAWRASLGGFQLDRIEAAAGLANRSHPPRFLAAHGPLMPASVSRPLLLAAWAKNPNNLPLAFAIGRLSSGTRLPVGHLEAAGFYRACLALQPGHTGALINLGVCLFATGDLDGAIDALTGAVAADPAHAVAHFNLGFALHMRSRNARRGADQVRADSESAKAAYRKAIELATRPMWGTANLLARAHTNLGGVHQDRGERADAIACYRKALAIDPTDANAERNLNDLLAGP